jgi:hypothetical protein
VQNQAGSLLVAERMKTFIVSSASSSWLEVMHVQDTTVGLVFRVVMNLYGITSAVKNQCGKVGFLRILQTFYM